MREADEKLAALFVLDEPPPRDAAFSAEVMEAVIRREFQKDVALLSAASLVGAAALWALWPVLQPPIVAVSQGLAPVVAGLALAACAVWLLGSRPPEPVEVES